MLILLQLVVTPAPNFYTHPPTHSCTYSSAFSSSLPLRPLFSELRLPPPDLRSARTRLSIKSPRPPNPNPWPRTNPQRPPGPKLPTLRMPDPRLEQVP